MKIDFKNKKVIIGGAVALVILVAGIVVAVLMLSGDKTTDSQINNNVVTEEPSTETEPSLEDTSDVTEPEVDTNTENEDTQDNSESTEEIELPTLEDIKLFNEEEWRGEDVDKAKAYNYYHGIKTDGTLKSPEKYLDYIKEVVGNKEDNIKSFPKKEGEDLTEVYKNTDTQNMVLKINLNEDKLADEFLIYDAEGNNAVKITTTPDGYVKNLYDNSTELRVLRREYTDGNLTSEIEIVRVDNGVITNTRTEFSADGTKCKQLLELKLTKQTEFKDSFEQFMVLLNDSEKQFFNNYVVEEETEVKIEVDTNTETEVESTEENKTE